MDPHKIQVTSHDVRACSCPHCEKINDAATGIGQTGSGPSEGDLAVCLYCSTVLKYDASKRLVFATKAEYDELEPELQVLLEKSLKNPVRFSA